MRPEEVREALARVREAAQRARARPFDETLEALADWLDGWSRAGSPWQTRLAQVLARETGFALATVREGLRAGLAPLHGEALRKRVRVELGSAAARRRGAGPRVAGFDTTAVVLAGAIPMPTLLALLAPLVLRSGVVAKTASSDPVTAAIAAETLAEIDSGLAECLAVVGFPGEDAGCVQALLEADCVAASGDDTTIAAIAARVQPPRRLVAHPHRLSVALLGPEATSGKALQAAAAGLARDVALWDQLGCLSPVAVYAAGDTSSGAAEVAEALAEALAEAAERWPRGRVGTAALARARHELDAARLRAAAASEVAVFGGPEHGWTVVREADAAPRPAPLHRFVRVHPVRRDPAAIEAALAPLAPRLAGVALAGFGNESAAVVERLIGLGASRICPPGRLQTPPLGWHQDHQGLLLPLARFCDVEIPG